jgi:hypothetical protein
VGLGGMMDRGRQAASRRQAVLDALQGMQVPGRALLTSTNDAAARSSGEAS